MVKKKAVSSKQSTVVSDQPTVNRDQQSPTSDQAGTIGYTVGQWAGHPQYRCRECAFDTLDLDVMLEHLLRVHSVIALKEPVPFPPSQPLTPSPSPSKGEGGEVEKADGIFEIDLKEDQ